MAANSRSLSPLEAKLILHLEWNKQTVVTIDQAMRVLGCSYGHARQVLHRLDRDHWLAQIVPGKYELIPPERGEFAFIDTNPLFIGSVLVTPYYFSFGTAAFFHGLTTQASHQVFVATTQGKTRRLSIRDREYRVIALPDYKFFGFAEAEAYGSPVNMAGPEKTLLDSLDRPIYAGDIPEIAAMLWRGKNIFDWQQVVDGALRFRSKSLLQRLGYLIDLLALNIDQAQRQKLLEAVDKNVCLLGQAKRWGTGGEYNSTWQVVGNISRQELLAEIEVY